MEAVGLHSSLESTIDHSPYVNITEDGMLAPASENTMTENTVSHTSKELNQKSPQKMRP